MKRSFLVNVASTMTLPVISAVKPEIKDKRTMVAPIKFPKESCGEFSRIELMPTNISGVEVATPSITKETIKVLKRRIFAVLIKLLTTRLADLAKTIRLAIRIRKFIPIGIV